MSPQTWGDPILSYDSVHPSELPEFERKLIRQRKAVIVLGFIGFLILGASVAMGPGLPYPYALLIIAGLGLIALWRMKEIDQQLELIQVAQSTQSTRKS